MAQFTSAGGAGVPVAGAFTSDITFYTVVNQSVPTANTEVTIVVPANAVWIRLYNRTEGLTKVAFLVGESGTNYSTLPPGSTDTYQKKSSTPMSLYVQCPKASQTLEVTYGHSS